MEMARARARKLKSTRQGLRIDASGVMRSVIGDRTARSVMKQVEIFIYTATKGSCGISFACSGKLGVIPVSPDFSEYAIAKFQPLAYPSNANLSTTWIADGSKPVLLTESNDLTNKYVICGLFCNGTCTSYIFSIFIFVYDPDSDMGRLSDAIWFANEDHPIRQDATLNLTAAGELVIQDVDGTKVWTTNTAGKSVVGMNLTGTGNLVLFDANNSVVWQSFDHPKDCLLPEQTLPVG
ncbi:hypothetical protein OSB04_018193 [Centaurea solstitialis]|uniref:Bulb-type lectin domain-containing protein n=1 Tax=Centaurea solstitialis TaxID=347529 RepID=A0AA38TBX2_9ASTR|nr:hypothetical protein OSB04_018193 [Centaurea solstitialis]